jgi:hypothetical protein
VDGVECVAKQQHAPFSGAASFFVMRRIPLAYAIVIVAGPGCSGWVIATAFAITIGTSNLVGLGQNAHAPK